MKRQMRVVGSWALGKLPAWLADLDLAFFLLFLSRLYISDIRERLADGFEPAKDYSSPAISSGISITSSATAYAPFGMPLASRGRGSLSCMGGMAPLLLFAIFPPFRLEK